MKSKLLAIALTLIAAGLLTVNGEEASVPCRCRLDKASLGQLLDLSLADPEAHTSTHALATFVARWHADRPDATEGFVAAGNQETRYFVKIESPQKLGYFDKIIAASDFKLARTFGLKEKVKIEPHRRDGVGGPLVAIRENRAAAPIEAFYPKDGIVRPLTAVVRLGKLDGGVQGIQITLHNPLGKDEIAIAGAVHPLKVDLSASWAAMLERSKHLNRSQRMDFGDKTPKYDPRLYLLEPYDPKKEPLIMVHGLLGTPLVWAELTNTLWADDEIRSRYQIWHFLYNTTAPPLYSGRVLRTQLRALRSILDPTGKDPAMQSTTMIAHSMGAIVSRSLLTKPGSELWEAAFTRSLESLKLSEADRAALREGFFWDSMPHVKRVIYIAPSHLGSDFADNAFGRIGKLAAKPPKNGFQDLYTRVSKANPGAFTDAYAKLGQGKLDSIHTLSPKLPTLQIHGDLPNNHPVREFSIIGNRGKSGPIEKSSDGIVSYWSSHIDRAESEKIVPSGHEAFENEEAVAEVKRILKLPSASRR